MVVGSPVHTPARPSPGRQRNQGEDLMLLAWVKKHKDPVAIAVAIAGIVVAIAIYLFSLIPTWYADEDGDGFGDPQVSTRSIWQPSSFVRNAGDCYDSNQNARPGVESYFGNHRGDGSFDYDCDGTSAREQSATGSCSNGTANQGWDGEVPACGEKGRWLVDCDRKVRLLRIEIVRESNSRIQKCR